MRNSTQKILVSLFPINTDQRVMLSTAQLRRVVPDLTDGGFRSLVLYLERKHWLLKEQAGSKTFLSITDTGSRALMTKFPALNPIWDEWSGDWQMLVFLEAPKGDKQFRYLREQLKNEHALPLSRGVYLKAKQLSDKLVQECVDLYDRSVLIFSVGPLQLGELRPIVTTYYDLSSLAAVYSSISSTVHGLLSKSGKQNKLSSKQKVHISSLIDRLINCLTEDPGFVRFYFPGLAGVRQILPPVQQIILL